MFINYFATEERSSPINMAVGRAILAGWLVWKTIMYDWQRFVDVPFHLTPEFAWALPPAAPGLLLTVEKWVLIGLLLLFAVGYRIRFTGGVGALVLAHLGTVRQIHVTSGETQSLLIGVYFLLVYAVYSETDAFSIDELRRTRNETVHSLRSFIVSGRESYRLPAMKWSLVITAIIYFGSGFDKLFPDGPLGGLSTGYLGPVHLSRIIVVRDVAYPWHVPVGPSLVEYPTVITGAAIGSLVVELGFLLVVLAGISITPLVLALFGFHTSILVLFGIFFVDNYLLLLTFVAWDRIYERAVSDRSLDIVFDGRCYFCMQSLYLFRVLDVNETVQFLPQRSAPDEYRHRDGVDFDSAMYAFDGDETYEGYYAFRELLRQFRVFFPVVWLMGLAPVARVGERVYQYVADNRGRQFTCRVDVDN